VVDDDGDGGVRQQRARGRACFRHAGHSDQRRAVRSIRSISAAVSSRGPRRHHRRRRRRGNAATRARQDTWREAPGVRVSEIHVDDRADRRRRKTTTRGHACSR
jgi:hypothetical protein